ncbi:hypothetical protein K8O68_12910 [Salipaludibacillus sp. CUR1]|uniref:IS66 family insertion sequence element accessory protein TnpA n=1 Tax=Salipaludibacillus sp. CUR1 TaxID=2820003 RepID=UPI001E2E7977|nr:hypothetical protein [Salipaludibacillus sp. CUR1]MCE7793321.1 hypothetical protein [Salipaludibacillus sp. CUR1]
MVPQEYRELWADRITQYKASGLSVVKWVETQEGITVHQVRYWIKKFNQEKKNETSSTWLPVNVTKPPAAQTKSVIKIEISEDFKVEVSSGFDETALRDVIRVLKTS